MITPEYFVTKHPDSEEAHQTALFCWARHPATISEWWELEWLHHIPNGGYRGDKRSASITGAKLKQQGVKAGVADVLLPVNRAGCSGLYIEMKKPSLKSAKNPFAGCSEDQLDFKDFVEANKYIWRVCYSYEEAKAELLAYLGRPL